MQGKVYQRNLAEEETKPEDGLAVEISPPPTLEGPVDFGAAMLQTLGVCA